MDRIEVPFTRVLNLLLARETWARDRLAPFAGEAIELRAPPLPTLRLCVAERGLVQPAAAAVPAQLTVTVNAGALVWLAKGLDHAMREIEFAGNQRLAAEVQFLVRNLRWDLEEDLARVFGDVLAHRMVADARNLADATAEVGRRLALALMEYAIEERSMLALRGEYEEIARANARLHDGLERLDERLERLANG